MFFPGLLDLGLDVLELLLLAVDPVLLLLVDPVAVGLVFLGEQVLVLLGGLDKLLPEIGALVLVLLPLFDVVVQLQALQVVVSQLVPNVPDPVLNLQQHPLVLFVRRGRRFRGLPGGVGRCWRLGLVALVQLVDVRHLGLGQAVGDRGHGSLLKLLTNLGNQAFIKLIFPCPEI